MKRYYYRVISGTMRVLVWANGYREAISKASHFRNWRALGVLTKFQRKTKQGHWGIWHYVQTKTKP